MLRMVRPRQAPAPAVSFFDIAHADRSYRVVVKRVSSSRRFTLRVRAATLDAVLTMPTRASIRAARHFAERHAEWIDERLTRLPQRIPFVVGSTIPFRGVDVPIVHRQTLRGVAWLDKLTLPNGELQPVLFVSGTPEQQPRRVLDFLRREARRDFEAAVERHTAAVGRRARAITLRDTRSRWGSCTAAGALNFSWRLIMAPGFVLDYLAAHEVAHLVHLNHSPAYWALAARLAPELEAAEAWLKRHGAGLHRYG